MAQQNLPPLTVHHLHISQSERIVWLCEELGISYTLKEYTRAPIFSPADLAALTPQKSAPVMTTRNIVTGEEIQISESGAIADYINSIYGGGKFSLKPDHKDYAQYLFWFHYANASLGPSFSRRMTTGLLAADPSNGFAKAVVQGNEKYLWAMDARLEHTNAYLAGEEFTLADIMTVWNLTTGRQWYPTDLGKYKGIMAYLERIGQREGYVRGIQKAEPGLDWKAGLTGPGPEIFGPYKAMVQGLGIDVENLKT